MLKKIWPHFKNRYLLTTVGFICWMLFFDQNDVRMQLELTQKLHKLELEKKYFVEEIARNKEDMLDLKTNAASLEKFARERYLMKKDNEDIFVLVPK